MSDAKRDSYASSAPAVASHATAAQGAHQTKPAEGFRRPRGHRAGLNIEKIVDAARSLPQDQLSMQAVANTLGVDRKALNHYVQHRENLLSIVAGVEFKEGFHELDLPAGSDWRTVAEAFAHNTANGMLAAGALCDYLRTGANTNEQFLDASERLIGSLIDAGLELEQATRCGAIIVNAVAAYARDIVNSQQTNSAGRMELLNESLIQEFEGKYPILRQVVKSGVHTTDDAQLDFAIDCALDSIEVLIQKNQKK